MKRRDRAPLLLRGRLPDPVPTGTTYKNKVESKALATFAEALANPTAKDFSDIGLDPEQFSDLVSNLQPRPAGAPARVVVAGGAVMDIIFRIPQIPDPDASVQARGFDVFPGGKGLSQAVACARLGMETSLISVVGDDPYGKQILEYLEKKNVDTSLVAIRRGEKSPVTGVITLDTGISLAIGWKNEDRLHFTDQDVSDPKRSQALSTCDFFLTSFELPTEATEKALAIAKANPSCTTIVTPAPPYEDRLLDPKHRVHMDFVVAKRWELTKFSRLSKEDIRASTEPPKIDDLAKPILSVKGIRNLLVTHESQCHAYVYSTPGSARAPRDTFIAPAWPTETHENAGDRDAFCAMLAFQLHALNCGAEMSMRRIVAWSTAAMACAGAQFGVPESMPHYEDVRDMIEWSGIHLPD